MSPTGKNEFECFMAEGYEGRMEARFDTDKYGDKLGWRCYAQFNTINSPPKASCIDNNGNLNDENCKPAVEVTS
jgi:hypothetical protein